MNTWMEVGFTALLAVTAENLIFTGGIGFSRVLRAARKPKTIGIYSLFVGGFSLVSALVACFWVRFCFPIAHCCLCGQPSMHFVPHWRIYWRHF